MAARTACIGVRDSKDGSSPVIAYRAEEWSKFLAATR
ncbi:DUF397 domain-containing protein [Embleya sp. NBC_00896]|nr:DUF397 domain-containing protein [Embleya sp. NBC_00896]